MGIFEKLGRRLDQKLGTERAPEKSSARSSSRSSNSPVPPSQRVGSGKRNRRYTPSGTRWRLYRDNLSPEAQEAYDVIESAMASHRDAHFRHPVSDRDFEDAIKAVRRDCPELFFVDGSSEMTLNDRGIVSASFGETMRPAAAVAQQKQIDNAVSGFLLTVGDSWSEYDKVEAAYEWIIDYTDYDKDIHNDQNMSSVFVDKRSSCAGYSRAFQHLCNEMGIRCTYVSGHTHGRRSEGHAWNMVNIDGAYYWVDVTWGDPVFVHDDNDDWGNINYAYICMSDRDLLTTHSIDANIEWMLPECLDNEGSWFHRHHLYFDKFDEDYIISIIQGFLISSGEGKITVPMRFARQDDFDKAHKFTQNISSIANPVLQANCKRIERWSWSETPELNVLKLQLEVVNNR